jgi:AGZA family xanthine/uracil permease-like MFS transporter
MHGEKIGFGESPVMALSYLGVATVLFACARSAAPYTAPVAIPEVHGGPEPLPAAE